MQMSKESECAIKLLCFMKQHDSPLSAAMLAQSMALDPLILENIVQALCEKHILNKSDTNKLVAFCCNPGELTLLSVIAAMEGSAKISASLEDGELPANDTEHELHRLHQYVQKGIERCYGAVTISDVVERAAARTNQAKARRLAAEQKAKERQIKHRVKKTECRA